MISHQQWGNNWLAVSPPGAARIDLGRSAASRRTAAHEVRDLPPGTPVVLSASAPRAVGRCRSFASAAGIELEREYLAFPSAQAPAYLVEDAPASASVFVRTILVAPPGTALSTAIDACLGILRLLPSSRLIRVLAPGRVVVGRRT